MSAQVMVAPAMMTAGKIQASSRRIADKLALVRRNVIAWTRHVRTRHRTGGEKAASSTYPAQPTDQVRIENWNGVRLDAFYYRVRLIAYSVVHDF